MSVEENENGEEQKRFVEDPPGSPSVRQKNAHLSAILAVAPWVTRKIVRIERINTGWNVYYQTAPTGGPTSPPSNP